MLHTSRLAVVGGPDGGAAGDADLTTTEEVVGTAVVRVSGVGAGGHGRNGGGSNSSLHIEQAQTTTNRYICGYIVGVRNECPLKE